MAMVSDIVKVTIKELNLNKVEPITPVEWSVINNYLASICK
jgi:hypothetical protein